MRTYEWDPCVSTHHKHNPHSPNKGDTTTTQILTCFKNIFPKSERSISPTEVSAQYGPFKVLDWKFIR